MEFERVQEIFESKGVIDVECYGKPIWITNIDKQNMTAEVKSIDNDSLPSIVVSIDELSEAEQ